jgi:hypothetical protein
LYDKKRDYFGNDWEEITILSKSNE